MDSKQVPNDLLPLKTSKNNAAVKSMDNNYNEKCNIPLSNRSKSKRTSTESSSEESININNNSGGRLKREISLANGVTIIVGSIIGSGIFVSPKGVSGAAGSVGLSLIVWLGAGIYSLIGAYCFAELGTLIDKSGADYAYIYEAFGPFLAFLRLWVECMISRPGTITIVALAFGKYIIEPLFYGCQEPAMAVYLLTILCISLLCFVNCFSVKLATYIQDFFTYAKVAALIMIIITGIVLIFQGETQNFADPFKGSDLLNLSTAVYQGLFAYNGWNYLNVVAEELKNPARNLPLAIWISLPLVIIIYVLTNVAYYAAVSYEEINTSISVAVLFAQKLYGPVWWIIPVFVSLSVFGTVNGTMFTGARLFFVGGREGHMPEVLNMIQLTRYTPTTSVLFTTVLSFIYLMISNDIHSLINYVGFCTWLSIGLGVVALIIFRKTKKNEKRLVKVWIGWPILYVLVTVWLIIAAFINTPTETGMGVIIILTGVPVYCLGVKWKNKPKSIRRFVGSITKFTQKFFLVIPEEKQK